MTNGTHGTEAKYMQSCVWLALLSESANLEEPGVDGEDKLDLKEDIGSRSIDWIHLAQDGGGGGIGCGLCEHGNEPSSFVKCVLFLD
jgi:hypothetical protein